MLYNKNNVTCSVIMKYLSKTIKGKAWSTLWNKTFIGKYIAITQCNLWLFQMGKELGLGNREFLPPGNWRIKRKNDRFLKKALCTQNCFFTSIFELDENPSVTEFLINMNLYVGIICIFKVWLLSFFPHGSF